MDKKVLLLGIGNLLMSDDGVGVHVVNSILESETQLPEYVEVIDGGTVGYDLLSIMKDREKIVIIDALKTDDVPGSIYRFTADHLLPEKRTCSLHDAGIRRLLDSLKILGDNPFVEIIGIVPEDINTLNIGLTEKVEQSIPKVVDQILDAVIIF